MKFITYDEVFNTEADKKLNFYNKNHKHYIFCIVDQHISDGFTQLFKDSIIYRNGSNLPISKLDLTNLESFRVYLEILIKEYESFRRLHLHQDSIELFSRDLQQYYEPHFNVFCSIDNSVKFQLELYLDFINPLITFNKFIFFKYENKIDFTPNINHIYIPFLKQNK